MKRFACWVWWAVAALEAAVLVLAFYVIIARPAWAPRREPPPQEPSIRKGWRR